MKRPIWHIAIALPILIGCAFYLYREFDWSAALLVLAQANWLIFLAGSAVLFLLNIVIRTCRWLLLIHVPGRAVSTYRLYVHTAVFVSVAMLTPGQLGEVLKLSVFRKHTGQTTVQLLGTFAVERLLDLFVVSIMAVYGLVVLVPSKGHPGILSSALLFIALLAAGVLVLRFARLPGLPGRMLTEFRAAQGRGREFAMALALTILAWFTVAIAWQLTLHTMHVEIDVSMAIALTGLTTLSVVLSLIPGGLGVSEVVISEFLQGSGISPSAAQAGSLMIRLLGLWWILVGLAHYPLRTIGHFGRRGEG